MFRSPNPSSRSWQTRAHTHARTHASVRYPSWKATPSLPVGSLNSASLWSHFCLQESNWFHTLYLKTPINLLGERGREREREREICAKSGHFLVARWMPSPININTVILMSFLRGDSLTSFSVTHRLLPSLTCSFTDFMHPRNEWLSVENWPKRHSYSFQTWSLTVTPDLLLCLFWMPLLLLFFLVLLVLIKKKKKHSLGGLNKYLVY